MTTRSRRCGAWVVAILAVAGCGIWLALRGASVEPASSVEMQDPAPVGRHGCPSGAEPTDTSERARPRAEVVRAAFVVLVRDPDGAAVAGAAVAADPLEPADDPWRAERWVPAEGSQVPAPTARTDARGGAVISDLTTGRWRVAAEAPGFARREVETAWVEGDPPRDVEVTLERAFALDVTVRDGAGAVAGGVVVRVVDFNTGPWPREWMATTTEEGTCRVEGLPRGTLAAACKGSKPDEWTFVRVPHVDRVDLVAPPTALGVAKATATFEVRVVDRYGAALAGADVVFAFRDGTVTGRGTSGEDGACRVSAVADALACVERIVVRRAGSATVRRKMSLVQVGAGGSHRFDDVVLGPEARLVGRVVGPEGPVAGANVTVWVAAPGPFGEMETEEATTGADGTYRLAGLAPGTVVVDADAPGLDHVDADEQGRIGGSFGPRSTQPDRVPDSAKAVLVAGAETTLDVQMKRTGPATLLRVAFTGVVRRTDGTPVPWAAVWATGATDHWFVHHAGRAITAADGSFRLIAEAAEGFRLHASARGLWTPESVEVPMTEPGTRTGIEIVVEKRPVVRGVVRSALGLPVAGARVLVGTHHSHKFNEATHWGEQPEGVVAADGSFEVPVDVGPFGGSSIDWRQNDMVVCVEADGHGPAISAPFTPEDLAAGKTFDFTLDEGAEITGRVVDGAGAPVAEAPITLVVDVDWNTENWPPRHPPTYGRTLAARAAANGSFRIAHLFPGAYEIATTVAGGVPESVRVKAPARDVEIRVRASLALAGIVLAPDGSPLPGAVLDLVSGAAGARPQRSGTTGDDGSFRFDGVAAGNWRLKIEPSAEGPAAQPLVLDVAAGATDLRIQTKPGLEIEGTLLDAEGKPVGATKVFVARADDGPGVWTTAETDEQGRFAFRHLAPGPHVVHFFDIDLGFEGLEPPCAPVLRIPGSQTISGTVRDRANESDVPHVGVRARRTDAPHGAPVDVHAAQVTRGAFTFRNLAPGTYSIEVSGHVSDSRHTWEWTLPRPTLLSAGSTGVVLTLDLRELPRTRDDR